MSVSVCVCVCVHVCLCFEMSSGVSQPLSDPSLRFTANLSPSCLRLFRPTPIIPLSSPLWAQDELDKALTLAIFMLHSTWFISIYIPFSSSFILNNVFNISFFSSSVLFLSSPLPSTLPLPSSSSLLLIFSPSSSLLCPPPLSSSSLLSPPTLHPHPLPLLLSSLTTSQI